MSTETEIPSRIKTTWLIGVLAAFAIFVVIAWYSGHMTRAYSGYDQERTRDRYITLAKLQKEENDTLNGPADWIDKDKKIIHLPIDEVLAKEVDILKMQPAQVGSAIPVIAPAAPAAPAKPQTTPSTNAAPAPAAPAPPKK